MSIRPIVRYPHPALKTPAKPVTAFDETLHRLLDDLAETMYAAEGIGLAANQIAVLQRVTVIDLGARDEAESPGDVDESQSEVTGVEDTTPAHHPLGLLELVNPQVVRGDGEIVWEEGCLSFPELYEKIDRAADVTVRYQDRHGETQTIEGSGLLAVALQHEIDHLDGTLFIDRLGPITRRLALKRFDRIMERRRREGLEP